MKSGNLNFLEPSWPATGMLLYAYKYCACNTLCMNNRKKNAFCPHHKINTLTTSPNNFCTCIIFRCVRKITKSDHQLRHICLPVRTEQLGSQWTDFHEISYLIFFFRKSVEKIQVSLKSDTNIGYSIWRPTQTGNNISLDYSYNEKNFRQKL